MVLTTLTSRLLLFPLNEFVGCSQLNGQLRSIDWYMNSFTCSLMYRCMIYFAAGGWLSESFVNVFIGGWLKWCKISPVYRCTARVRVNGNRLIWKCFCWAGWCLSYLCLDVHSWVSFYVHVLQTIFVQSDLQGIQVHSRFTFYQDFCSYKKLSSLYWCFVYICNFFIKMPISQHVPRTISQNTTLTLRSE